MGWKTIKKIQHRFHTFRDKMLEDELIRILTHPIANQSITTRTIVCHRVCDTTRSAEDWYLTHPRAHIILNDLTSALKLADKTPLVIKANGLSVLQINPGPPTKNDLRLIPLNAAN